MATGFYIFCLGKTADLAKSEMPHEEAIDCPFVYRSHDLSAVAKIVPLEEFCGANAQQRLEDPGWVTPRAIEHGRVIAEVFRNNPVLPVPFGTLFSSGAALEQFLDHNAALIEGFFEYAGGCEEWGIKALLDRDRLRRFLVSSIVEEESAAISPGLRYLRQRRAEQLADKQLSSWLELHFKLIVTTLGECSIEVRQRRVLDDSARSNGLVEVLNLATLIRRGKVTELEGRIEAVNVKQSVQGLSFALTGPWPPYSFCPPLDVPQ